MGTNVQSFAVANLRRRPVAVEAGGFVAGFDPDTTSPYINYATPLPGAEPTRRDVDALIAAFRTRGLRLRLEFAPDAAPEVEPALRGGIHRGGGARVPGLHPGHADGAGFRGGPSRRDPVSDQDYASIGAALSEAFTGEFAPSPHGAARLRRTEENGGAVRFVRSPDGGCAGGASCSAPAVGTSELSGVGTRSTFRGRGIATAVTAALTEAMFALGARSVWLEYSGEGSRRVYERVGYHPQGARLYMSLEE